MNFPKRDLITGLRLKPALNEEFLKLAGPSDIQISLLFIDIDGLAWANQQYGPFEADKFLHKISKIIACESANYEVFRIGGDEFAMLMGVNLQAAAEFAEQIRKRVEVELFNHKISRLVRLAGSQPPTYAEVSLTVSCAVALYPQHGTTLDSLLQAADLAMYREAKLLGGNSVTLVGG
ncbi:GGDEF domain-containing protein [Kamptonema formosum]|uniref:GGDEF domain-containing protein n=1 Tax=Kamptonema formosum TaxID=331992 RepID=UPI0003483996|nr:GGDEF domain-containing protein [Oscillatoria sp. PCC 10802]